MVSAVIVARFFTIVYCQFHRFESLKVVQEHGMCSHTSILLHYLMGFTAFKNLILCRHPWTEPEILSRLLS
jgi:hypothetical protein